MGTNIEAFVGDNGDGKTLGMTYFAALKSLSQGRPVWANYHIDHPLAHAITDWEEIKELPRLHPLSHGDIERLRVTIHEPTTRRNRRPAAPNEKA